MDMNLCMYKYIREYVNTDLAVEEREKYENNVEIPGVVIKKKHIKDIGLTTTRMEIVNEEGVKHMGKPLGTYVTLESDSIREYGIGSCKEKCVGHTIEEELLSEIRNMIKKEIIDKILVVGLGNENATPDALGPKTVEKIMPKEKVMCFTPGVLAQTGMETFKIVKGVVTEVKPDLILVIDSLAARNVKRVGTTIQLTNTGIIPGSGVGNHRMGINKETIGVDVIAIGVPMVVNCITIVHDVMMDMAQRLGEEYAKNIEEDIYEYSNENPSMESMYVTPKDVDEMIANLSFIISRAINKL